VGHFVCFVESALCLAASYWVAAAVYPDASSSHRSVTTGVVFFSLLSVVMQALGYAGHLDRLTLGIVTPLACALLALLASRRLRGAALRRVVMNDLDAPRRVVSDVLAYRQPLLFVVPVAGVVLVGACVRVWVLPSWAWDALWYHTPMTSLAIQDASLRFRDAHLNQLIEGYPNGVELVGVWLCIFAKSDRLEDAIQLPFVPLGLALIYAWCRRLGTRRAVSLALAAGWLLLPPVFLLLATGYNDVACGVLLACGVYFASGKLEARERLLACLALALYVASKYSAVFHLALLSPYLAYRVGAELWERRRRWLRATGSVLLSVVPFLAIALPDYLDNWLARRNPMWPALLKVPFTHTVFPGPLDPDLAYVTHPSFFRGVGTLLRFLGNWWTPANFYRPDVNEGGFGPAARWLLIPCVVIVVAEVVRGHRWRELLPVAGLGLLAILGPFTYVPRFAMGLSFAMLIAAAYALDTSARPIRWIVSIALCALLLRGYAEVKPERAMEPSWDRVVALLDRTELERAVEPLLDYRWPAEVALAREQLPEGSVIVYDESLAFVEEAFTRDYHTTARYVPSSADPEQFVRHAQELGARWAIVAPMRSVGRRLTAAGARLLYTPNGAVSIYQLPVTAPSPTD
jgi:phosphate/sulfate permease